MDCSTPGFPVHYQLSELAETQVHGVSDAIQPSNPLLSPSPPALNLSQHQDPFQWVSLCIRWSKYWSFSFSISPSNESSGLISFRMDWLDLLAVQGTLKSLSSPKPQFRSINFSVLSFLHSSTLTSLPGRRAGAPPVWKLTRSFPVQACKHPPAASLFSPAFGA